MKRLFLILFFLIFTLVSNQVTAQLARTSWSTGFGITYPRIMSLWKGSYSGINNYGIFGSIQRHFSENVSGRFKLGFNYIETKYSDQTEKLKLLNGDFDLLYYLVPCEEISPYVLAGFGGIYFKTENTPEKILNNKSFIEYQFNLGIGVEWQFANDWKIKTEGSYHTSSTNKLDGQDDPGSDKGLFGGNSDTYVTLEAGVVYYFGKGEPSRKCDLYSGVTAQAPNYPTLEQIDSVIQKHIPKEVVKQIVVEKPVSKDCNIVLVGVNFDFNSAKLKPESYPILYHAVQYLLNNPEIKIEIQGYTDDIGSENYNQMLSELRAQAVKDYLVSKGISENRLTVKGFGETKPVSNNKSSEGRLLNRRIEFKVIN